MKNDDVSRPGEVTDEELDQFLTTGDRELLDHIQATIDPNRLLTDIMDHPGPEAPASGIRHAPGQASAREMIRTRAFATRFVRALTCALDLVRDLTFVFDRALERGLALALERDLTLAFHLDFDLVRDHSLERDLERARARARDLVHAFDHDLDRIPIGDLVHALEDARISAQCVVSRLNAQQVDASDADLSDMEIEHIEALDGVVWTRRTIWPPAIAGQVEEHSAEIGDGVYQVRLGQRDEARV